jgi:mannitol-1-/sugar-/sorbitol-6-phosphatase
LSASKFIDILLSAIPFDFGSNKFKSGDQMSQLVCQAIIFDLDGVLVDSVPGVLHIWREWAQHHGITHPDLDNLAITTRTEEAVQRLAPYLNVQAEVEYLEGREATAVDGLEAIKGANSLLSSLPSHCWGVFTSVNQETALAKLRAANLPEPLVLVSGDRVQWGKPNPDGYLLASQELGVAPQDCLVIEDTPVGVQAARASGMPVIALATTCSPEQLVGAQAVLPNLEGIQITLHSSEPKDIGDYSGNRPTLVLNLDIPSQV